MKTEKELGVIIRKLRGDMSLRDFAKKCDISHTTIDNLEKGIDFRTGKPTQAKLATLQKIANACGVSISYLTEDNDKKYDLQLFASDKTSEAQQELPIDSPPKNSVIIFGRDGSRIKSDLSDDQIELVQRMVEQFDHRKKKSKDNKHLHKKENHPEGG